MTGKENYSHRPGAVGMSEDEKWGRKEEICISLIQMWTPLSKEANQQRLPEDEERETELKHLLTANLAAMILGCANTYGNHIVCVHRVCVTEMSKRNSAVDCETILEQENIQLRARIQDLEARYAKLESSAQMMSGWSSPKCSKKNTVSRSNNVLTNICLVPLHEWKEPFLLCTISTVNPYSGHWSNNLMLQVVKVVITLAESLCFLREEFRSGKLCEPRLDGRSVEQKQLVKTSSENTRKTSFKSSYTGQKRKTYP